ncbi:MAG: hypothetical protein QOD86_1843 [Miltoncostaeaceae bacterium]|nr:hypothetical protein [Miltoncostaeaceae bacterium]
MRVSGQGIALDAPPGWDVRIARDPDDGLAVVHAASFPLPPAVGGFGGEAIDAMPPESVVLSLLEYEPAAAGRGLFAGRAAFAALRVRDLDPSAITRALPGRAGVQRFAVLAGRPFCAYVVVSRSARPRRLLETANRLLASLEIAPRGA